MGKESSQSDAERAERLSAASRELDYQLGAGDVWEAVGIFDAIQKELAGETPSGEIAATLQKAKDSIEAKLDDPDTLNELFQIVTQSLVTAENALDANDLKTAATVLEECKNITLALNDINKEKFRVRGSVFTKYHELMDRLRAAKAEAEAVPEQTIKTSVTPEPSLVPESDYQKIEAVIQGLEAKWDTTFAEYERQLLAGTLSLATLMDTRQQVSNTKLDGDVPAKLMDRLTALNKRNNVRIANLADEIFEQKIGEIELKISIASSDDEKNELTKELSMLAQSLIPYRILLPSTNRQARFNNRILALQKKLTTVAKPAASVPRPAPQVTPESRRTPPVQPPLPERSAALDAAYEVQIKPWKDVLAKIPKSRQDMQDRGLDTRYIEDLIEEVTELFTDMQLRGVLEPTGDDLLDKRRENVINQRATAISNLNRLKEKRATTAMTLKEVADEYTSIGTYENSPRIQELLGVFEGIYGKERDSMERSLQINRIATVSAVVTGTSGVEDWATNLNKVEAPFTSKNGSMKTIAEGFFYKRPEGLPDGVDITSDDILRGFVVDATGHKHEIEIDENVPKMWRYVVSRIKEKPEYNGTERATRVKKDARGNIVVNPALPADPRNPEANAMLEDNTGGLIARRAGETDATYQARLREIRKYDRSFSYNALNNQVIDTFHKHLQLVFSDVPEEKLMPIIYFYKTFGGKSAGYIPYLIRGTTRAHGFKVKETETDDEAKFDNPFALRLYQATRYEGTITFARFMSRFQYVQKEVFLHFVHGHSSHKVDDATELYEQIEDFNKAKWGGIPAWIEETQRLFGHKPEGESLALPLREKPLIDLNDCVFPLVPDMFAKVYELEIEKRRLFDGLNSRSISRADFNAAVEAFVQKYRYQGYFNDKSLLFAESTKDNPENDPKKGHLGMLNALKGDKFFLSGDESGLATSMNFQNYDLAANAVVAMFDNFDKPEKMDISEGEAIAKFRDWNQKIIGKAKLVPGPHQLLFAAFTCEKMVNLIYACHESHNADVVHDLYKEMMELVEAPGLPAFLGPQVHHLMQKRINAIGWNKVSDSVLSYINHAPDYLVNGSRGFGNLERAYMHRIYVWKNRHDNKPFAMMKKANPLQKEGEFRAPYSEEEVVSKKTEEKGEEH